MHKTSHWLAFNMPLIEKISVRDISINSSNLQSEDAKRFVDPSDVRLEARIVVKTAKYSNFLVGWLIHGLTDQKNVKHLLADESNFRYLSYTQGDSIATHGHCSAMYDGLIHLPINQDLELGTVFSLAVNNIEGKTIRDGKQYAITILSDKLLPTEPLPKGVIPFNRRAFLLHVYPGEVIDGRVRATASEDLKFNKTIPFL